MLKLILGLMLGYLLFCLIMFAWQSHLLYYPQPRLINSPESTMLLAVEGAELVVTVAQHKGPKAIVYFGGNAEDVSLNLPLLTQTFPDTALYLLHYRGYGGSTGSPSQQHNQQDALALFDDVISQHDEVTLIGRSLGTAMALFVASQRPVAKQLLITPFDSLQDVAVAQFPYLPVRYLMRDRYDVSELAPTVTAATHLLIAGKDELIPRASSERLYERFELGVATMEVAPSANHNSVANTAEFWSALWALK
jgi:pimeloyl-ACP methyl ester carboxylesterase